MGNNLFTQQESAFMTLCRKASIILLFTIFIDCAVAGSGIWIIIGSFGIRMILYMLFCAISLPLVFKKFLYLVRNRYFFPFIPLAVWILIETAIGIYNGNRQTVIQMDIEGFLSFGILPGAFCVLDNKSAIKKLAKAVVYIGAAYAIATCIFLVAHLHITAEQRGMLCVTLNHVYELTTYSPLSEKIPRIFSRSQLYLLFSCACALYFAITEEGKKRKYLYAAVIGLNLFSLLITYTRSIYFAALVAVVSILLFGLLILDKKQNIAVVKTSCMGVGVFLVIVLIFNLSADTDYLGYGLQRSMASFETPTVTEPVEPSPTAPVELSPTAPVEPSPTAPVELSPTAPVELSPTAPVEETPSTEDTYLEVTKGWDSFRQQVVADLMVYIKASPVIGHGIGAALSYRDATEYFWLNIIHKMGLIGLALYIAPIVLALVFLLGKRSKALPSEERYMLACWMAGLLGICGFCCFNPYLNGSNGIVFYCCTMAVFNIFDPDTEIFRKKTDPTEGASV